MRKGGYIMGEYSKEQIVKVLEERGTIQVKDNEGMAYQISLRKDDAKVYVNYCEGDNNCFTYNGFIDWKYLVDNWGVHDCIVTYEVFKASLKEDGEEKYVPNLEKVLSALGFDNSENGINTDEVADLFDKMKYQLAHQLI